MLRGMCCALERGLSCAMYAAREATQHTVLRILRILGYAAAAQAASLRASREVTAAQAARLLLLLLLVLLVLLPPPAETRRSSAMRVQVWSRDGCGRSCENDYRRSRESGVVT